MSVNGIKLAVGQKWKTKNYGVVTLSDSGISANYPWRMNFPNNGDPIGSITTDGKYWAAHEMPELLECIYNPEDKEEKKPMKFNPQPGDKIICNNDDDYDIREVIPQNSEVTDDKKEEVKEEPRYKAATAEQPLYTVEEVIEAIQLVTPNEASWNWVPEIKEHLNKAKDPQYLEYLRLKAIYE